jgi:hypothetical protein
VTRTTSECDKVPFKEGERAHPLERTPFERAQQPGETVVEATANEELQSQKNLRRPSESFNQGYQEQIARHESSYARSAGAIASLYLASTSPARQRS